MSTLQGKTLFITGASRGIGKAIALRAAADGANVAIAAKTVVPHPVLPGTIHTAAEEIGDRGGQALALRTDIRHPDQVEQAIATTVETFGGLDILVNNASAIYLAGTVETPVRRFDLMHQVNARGTWLCSRAAIPHLAEAANPHILNISPPLSMEPRWFEPHCAYTMAKYGMSLCVLGMAGELRDRGIAVNALWPRTIIDTAALRMLGDLVRPEQGRKPEIMADAAHHILTGDSRRISGNFFVDEEVLRSAGVTDFDPYAVQPGEDLVTDLFLDSGPE